ncbi:hypothetical protein ACFVWL_18950 [Microbacterium sp. NPDC058269]|uniref:hypothetical protein n=1 Tax=Microbacterium sp. NPDC058269 TaxID=3346414 RepID=UPI0036DA1987
MRYPELDTADKARSVAILNLLTEQNLLVQIVGDSLELKPGDLSGEFLALEIARGLHRVLHDRTKPREMFSTLARKGKSPVVQAVASVQLSASLLRDRIEDEMIDEHFALAASAVDRVDEGFLRELLLSRTLRARALAEFRHVELRKQVFDDGAALVQALAFGERAAKVAASSYERHLAEENLKIVWESTLKASIALNHAELFEKSFETLKKMDPNDPSLYVLAARAGSSVLPWDARLRLLRKGAGLGSPLAVRARELVAEHEIRS